MYGPLRAKYCIKWKRTLFPVAQKLKCYTGI